MKRTATLIAALLFLLFHVQAQVKTPSTWKTSASKQEVKVGEEIELIFEATIDPEWYLYSSDFDPDCGPMVTTFHFNGNESYELIGDIQAIKPIEKFDDVFECNVRIFKKHGEFRQKIKVLSPDLKVTGNYEFQVCSDISGQCIPFDYDFEFSKFKVSEATESITPKPVDEKPKVAPAKAEEPGASSKEDKAKVSETKDSATATSEVDEQPKENTSVQPKYDPAKNTGPIMDETMKMNSKKDQSLLWFMIVAFVAGLTALLTPCVFPMIPMTVSYFTSKKHGVGKALIYGLSIIVIYTLIGSALAPIMGPETANSLATDWLPNVIFFTIFIVFALSFFGLFDITLPNSFVNSVDQKADKGGMVGVFFMAFTLVLVSFSCTGPIVGSLLVSSAGGEVLKPVLGMFAFSLAFAIPFTVFAIFPGLMNNLPKSGGWLNSVKVILGFIELALAFKFLSIADQAYHWGILDREINIAIWIVVGAMMGFYLLGKIRLPHDSKLEIITVPRLILAILTFTFVMYLIPGMWGAPLKALAGYLPPMHTHDFNVTTVVETESEIENCEEPKYADFLHLPHGISGYFDYDQALACARAQNKPLFIDFTGHGCTNCREMEAVVWSDPEVLKRLKEDYVVVALYVDDKTELPEEEWYTSKYDDKVKKTIGKQNADLQITNLDNNAQPFYVLVGADEKVLIEPVAYDKDVQNFIDFLDTGKRKYNEMYK